MTEWKECKLGDIAYINMGQSPESKYYNNEKIGLPFLQGSRTFGRKYPFFDTYCSKPKKTAKTNEILFSVRAPVGAINIANTDICIGRGVASLNSKNNDFLYFLLQHIKEDILNFETGSVFGAITKSDLNNINILLPPLPEQKAIASVLSSLDDKIDLLHRQNKTLEGMAEALFRQWFIEEAKEDWETKKLGDIINISSGKGLKRNEYDEYGIYRVLGANGLIGKTNKYLFDEKLIFTGRVGTLGNVFIVNNEKVWLSDNTLVIKSLNNFYFIYFTLKNARLAEYNVGSTQPLIRQSDIKEIEISLPNNNILVNFEKQSESLFNKIYSNQKQIQTLENLRDTLLPKLMSGEVRVNYE